MKEVFGQKGRHDIKRTPVILGLSAALCMPSAFVFANTNGYVENESIQAVLQSRTVKGKILDETGEPLIGVSVLVKGTTIGTITDFDGNFSLDVPQGKSQLEVSYVGYKSQTVALGSSNQVSVKMQPDTKTLDEVVVVGYGTMKKRDLTGSITSVKSDDITLNPGSNPMQALQGKVAGLDITKTSGQAGSGVSMQLRGTRSFTASGDPTFIIDGMPGDYSTLNPNDIESIEVLKDASSTAVYGASGANGVIIITTKNGKAGKINVDFNAYVGVNGWSKVPEVRSGDSYANTIIEAQKAAGNTGSDETLFNNAVGAGAYALHQSGQYIDWADELLKTGVTQNYSVSVSGGTDKTKAYMSLNFTDEAGQYSNDDYKLYSSNIRVDHKVRNWLSLGVNAQMSYVHQNKAYAKLESALTSVPLGSVYDEDGNMNAYANSYDNQVNLLLNNNSNYRNNSQNYKLYFNPYIELKPVKGLTILSRIGATLTNSRSNYFQGVGSYQYYNAGETSGKTSTNVYASIATARNYNYKWENVFTYNFKVARDHDFTITAVTSWNHNQYDYTYQKETNIADNAYMWYNMGLNQDNVTATSTYNMSKGFGLIGRINYSYKGKYLFSASVRHDGSSRLAAGNRWDTFPAVSLGWRISDESFMENTKDWLSNLKLRVGYGVTGTASINPYSTSSVIEASTLDFSGSVQNIYRFSSNYTNRALGWEKSHNTNIGLDAAFFNNRIDLTADYYITNTDGVIWSRQIPVVNGAYNSSTLYTMNMNICETKNTGFELALNTRNIDTRDFKWNSTVTFNYNKEKIKSLTDGTADNITNGDYALTIGQPVNSFYTYKIDGMWQKGEEADAAVFGKEPGDIKINVPGMYKESDGVFYKIGDDGEKVYYNSENKYAYSDKDYQTIGHNSPDWSLGFQNTFYWKNFDLSVFAYMRWGQTIKYSLLGDYDPTGKGNFPTYFNYWTEDNPSNDFPAINANRSITSYTGYSALQYVDGSFFKIKNITLGYTLPKNVLTKAGISKCRFYATITNPFVVAKSHLLKDYDPEMNGSLNYPLTKQMVFGVNLSF
jgi:TonB-linked SusC/RagA family outer membrane protein